MKKNLLEIADKKLDSLITTSFNYEFFEELVLLFSYKSIPLYYNFQKYDFEDFDKFLKNAEKNLTTLKNLININVLNLNFERTLRLGSRKNDTQSPKFSLILKNPLFKKKLFTLREQTGLKLIEISANEDESLNLKIKLWRNLIKIYEENFTTTSKIDKGGYIAAISNLADALSDNNENFSNQINKLNTLKFKNQKLTKLSKFYGFLHTIVYLYKKGLYTESITSILSFMKTKEYKPIDISYKMVIIMQLADLYLLKFHFEEALMWNEYIITKFKDFSNRPDIILYSYFFHTLIYFEQFKHNEDESQFLYLTTIVNNDFSKVRLLNNSSVEYMLLKEYRSFIKKVLNNEINNKFKENLYLEFYKNLKIKIDDFEKKFTIEIKQFLEFFEIYCWIDSKLNRTTYALEYKKKYNFGSIQS